MGSVSPVVDTAVSALQDPPTTRHRSARGVASSPGGARKSKHRGCQLGAVAPNRGLQHRVDKRLAAWQLWQIQTESAGLHRGISLHFKNMSNSTLKKWVHVYTVPVPHPFLLSYSTRTAVPDGGRGGAYCVL